MGARWYKDGKFDLKANTFLDTASCIDHLIDLGYTKPGMIGLKGRSAGGLVAGDAIVSPLSKADVVIAHVPFIDPIYDMIDDSVPWTAYEWSEWGNPETNTSILDAMVAYSPYHNIVDMDVDGPAVYVSSGVNDPRVPFWEPLKFVAKLRTRNSGDRPILMRVDYGGHFSAHASLATSEWIAFLISQIKLY